MLEKSFYLPPFVPPSLCLDVSVCSCLSLAYTQLKHGTYFSPIHHHREWNAKIRPDKIQRSSTAGTKYKTSYRKYVDHWPWRHNGKSMPIMGNRLWMLHQSRLWDLLPPWRMTQDNRLNGSEKLRSVFRRRRQTFVFWRIMTSTITSPSWIL